MKKIPLSQGKYAIVDDGDYEYLNRWGWYCNRGYAVRHPKMVNGIRKGKIAMHRVILNPAPELHTDHINGDTLDNRRENLRMVTSEQNGMNSVKPSHNTSGYEGVTWLKNENKWQARISAYGIRHFLGNHGTAKQANIAVTAARKVLQGEYEREDK